MKKGRSLNIVLAILMAVMSILTYWVKIGCTKEFDELVYNLFYHNDVLTTVMIGITSFGGIIGLILITILLFLVIPNKKYPTFLFLDLSIIAVLNKVFKSVICRARPVGIALVSAGGYSFPSGHSSAAIAFYGLLVYFIYKNIKSRKLKWFMIVALCLLVLSIGISRIYLGVHCASDVLGGLIFGLIHLIIFIKILNSSKFELLWNGSKSLK